MLEPRNRATLANISPRTAKARAFSSPSCSLGISLGTDHFAPPQARATVQWISRHFANCAVIAGDSIHRLTLRIRQGLDDEAAVAAAKQLGSEYLRVFSNLVVDFPSTKFEFLSSYQIQETEVFCDTLCFLRRLLGHDSRFSHSVDRDATRFVLRCIKRGLPPAVSRELALDLSRTYVLEELALFTSVVARGYVVDVYPGADLQVLAEIAQEMHPTVPPELKKRVNIAHRLRHAREPLQC
jgi:tRNA-dependent cyclodipeptide synthase